MAKSYRLTFDYVLYEMSYVNLLMYGAVLPNYSSHKDRKKGKRKQPHERIKADDPKNREKVRQLLESLKD